MAARKSLTAPEAEEYTKNLGSIVVGNFGLMEFARDTLRVHDALDLTFDAWVQNRLGGFVQRSVDQRREAVRELSGEKTGEGNNARYERSAKNVAELLGIGERTVEEDRQVNEERSRSAAPRAKALESGDLPAAPRANLTPEQKKPAIRKLLVAGKTNAEIAIELNVGVSTVGKERTAWNKEKNDTRDEGAKATLDKLREQKAKSDTRTPAEVKADEALLSEIEERGRHAIESAFGLDKTDVTEGLGFVAEAVHGAVEHNREIVSFEKVCSLWAQIGDDLWMYGAKKGIDVSVIAKAIERMSEEGGA